MKDENFWKKGIETLQRISKYKPLQRIRSVEIRTLNSLKCCIVQLLPLCDGSKMKLIQQCKKISLSFFQGFYIFLLIVSIAFLLFVFSYMVRLKTLTPERVVVSKLPVHRPQRETGDRQSDGFYIRLGAVCEYHKP